MNKEGTSIIETVPRFKENNCMLNVKRLQWDIGWKRQNHDLGNLLLIIVIVGVVSSYSKIGYAAKVKYARDYIPFEIVLKKNFISLF